MTVRGDLALIVMAGAGGGSADDVGAAVAELLERTASRTSVPVGKASCLRNATSQVSVIGVAQMC